MKSLVGVWGGQPQGLYNFFLKKENEILLTPSYSELMETLNTGMDDSKITSRYTIVLAVAKRAREIIDGSQPLTYAPTDRAVSIAVKEMGEGKIKINAEANMLDGSYERILQTRAKNRNITTVTRDDLREDLKDEYEPLTYSDDDDGMEDEFKDGFQEADEEYLYEDEGSDDALEPFDDEEEI